MLLSFMAVVTTQTDVESPSWAPETGTIFAERVFKFKFVNTQRFDPSVRHQALIGTRKYARFLSVSYASIELGWGGGSINK